MTHTPGPWKAGRGVDDDAMRCFVTQGISGQPEYLIAEIHNGAPGDSLETELANARLIASAPDLLAALKFALSEDSGFACPASTEARLRAAIQKAEGR